MRLHLDHNPAKTGIEINHSHKIFMAGSCFVDNIGSLLGQNKFEILSNPNGIQFNPSSIFNGINSCINPQEIDERFILNRDDIFFSYLHHSSVHAEVKSDLIKKINTENKKATQFLKTADFLFITFGSAYVYRHLELEVIVSNCHKQAGNTFEKSLLKIDGIVNDYSNLISALQTFNPSLRVIFTVSPVKYLKDGILENNLSKSTLLLSIHELTQRFKNCHYFPAYELVTDDLRDYRFYKEDMAHPNEQAIQYVWEKFSECYFSKETLALNLQIQKLNLALNHRSLIHNSAEAFKLNDFIIKQKQEIHKLNPTIKF